MVSHQGRRRTVLATAASIAAVFAVGGAVGVSPASADVACAARTTTTPFMPWGDGNRYFMAPNGGFEGGSANWTLSGGASVVNENEPWRINGSTHARSLRVPAGSQAVGERFCVNSSEDSLRFFYKRPGVAGSALHIHVRVTSGVNVATNDLDLDGGQAGWAVANRMMLPDIRDASGKQWVQITYSTRNVAANWSVDDVMVDPWRTN